VVKVEPTRPKLVLGVVGSASCKVYQNVWMFPRILQATACQYFSAFGTLATAWPDNGPLTGQPVSVIQTGFPFDTAIVLL